MSRLMGINVGVHHQNSFTSLEESGSREGGWGRFIFDGKVFCLEVWTGAFWGVSVLSGKIFHKREDLGSPERVCVGTSKVGGGLEIVLDAPDGQTEDGRRVGVECGHWRYGSGTQLRYLSQLTDDTRSVVRSVTPMRSLGVCPGWEHRQCKTFPLHPF